jgi:glycosyltransferase involved in cell wall biosynthesis
MNKFDTPGDASLNVTVIVCSCNRAESLAATLESLAASRVAESITWEVLVVDNNSADQTREVAQDFYRRYPGRFRCLSEPTPGKSYALNTGVANARGEVLAFIDDDVTVEATWLQNLTAELRGGEWAGVAGRILSAQPFTPPPWLNWNDCMLWQRGGGFRYDPLSIVFAHFDLGDRSGKLDTPPCGANMAFRKSMFEKYGGFRVDLGPSPNRDVPRPCEDTEFGRRLLKAGECLRYEPSAVVYHPVPTGRVKKDYVLSFWFDFGRATIRERGDRPAVHGIPWDYLSLMQRVINISLASLQGIFAFRPDKRFFFKCMVRMQTGMMVELYRRLANHEITQAAAL